MVNTLLGWWANYLESPEYLRERARARRVDETNAEAVNEKQRQVQLKMKAHSLRHQVRQAKALQRDESKITKDNRQLYDK